MFRVMRLLCLGLVSSFVMTGVGLAEMYQIDRSHSSVAFSIKHLVSRTSGRLISLMGGLIMIRQHLKQ